MGPTSVASSCAPLIDWRDPPEFFGALAFLDALGIAVPSHRSTFERNQCGNHQEQKWKKNKIETKTWGFDRNTHIDLNMCVIFCPWLTSAEPSRHYEHREHVAHGPQATCSTGAQTVGTSISISSISSISSTSSRWRVKPRAQTLQDAALAGFCWALRVGIVPEARQIAGFWGTHMKVHQFN